MTVFAMCRYAGLEYAGATATVGTANANRVIHAGRILKYFALNIDVEVTNVDFKVIDLADSQCKLL